MRGIIMEQRKEIDIKIECMEDLNITMKMVKKSDHPDKERINSSLNMIESFCDRWWEV